MTQLFANNATTTLANAITAAATSMVVAAGAGAKFPSPTAGDYFMLTLFQMVAGVESNYEVVKVTGRSVDTLTIVRAQESTTARAFGVGDQVSLRATASALNNFAQLASGGTFGSPIFAPTAVAGTNTTQVATTAFATTAVANAVATLIGTAPGVLDTLGELADALNDDAAFSATVTTALTNRLRTDTAAQGLTGTQKLNATTNLGLAAVASSGLKADVGLGNVDNTSDVAKPVSTAQQTALNLKADLASPTFTGDPKAPTATSGDNDTSIATTAFVQLAANGLLSKSIAGAVDVTLTAAEAGYASLKLTGAITANINVIVPSSPAVLNVLNATTGAFTVTIKTAAGTGVTVTQGAALEVVCDGTNVVSANTDFRDVALTGNPTAPTAAVGDNDTSIANTAFVQAAMGAFGIGVTNNNAINTIDDMTMASGLYYANNSTVGTYPNGVATPGFILHKMYGTAGFQLFQPYLADRIYFRRRNASAWVAWNEVPTTVSPAFTGTPTAPTAAANTNTTQIATTAFVSAAVASLVNSSPAALDTLSELATALGNDANFATTMTNALAAKAPLASPALTGVPVAPTAASGTNTTQLATTAFVQQTANGLLAKSVAGSATVTLTAVEAGYATLQLTGAITANINVVVPTAAAVWTIINATTGAFTVTVKTSAGTGVVVTQGAAAPLVCDGVNVIKALSDLKDLPLTGVPTAPTAAANTNTTQLATTAFVAAAAATKAPLAGSSTQSFAANDMVVNSLNGAQLAGFRNVLINGDMRIAQRALPGTSGYTLDRWIINTLGTPVSVSQFGPSQNFASEASSIVANVVGAAGNTAHNLAQRIESANCRHMAGKQVTLGFWHFNNTGASQVVGCSMEYATAGLDNFNTTTSIGAAAGTTCPNGQWTFVSASFTVPTAAVNGLQVLIGWGYGPVLAGQSVAYGNVQLELGAVATPFEHRPYATELILCQRYYEAISYPAAFTGGGVGSLNSYYVSVPFKVAKRAVPTVVLPSSTNAAWDLSGVSTTPTTWSIRDTSAGGFTVVADSSTRIGGIQANTYTANAEL